VSVFEECIKDCRNQIQRSFEQLHSGDFREFSDAAIWSW